jgi:uncharacterized protein (TIGR02246 family)
VNFETSDQQAIADLVAKWQSATSAGDVDAVLRLMAPDVAFLSTGNPPMRGRDAFGAALRSVLQLRRIESTGEVVEIRVSGDMAFCWADLTVRMIPLVGGEPVVHSGSALSVLHKQSNGDWVVVRDANMLTLTL